MRWLRLVLLVVGLVAVVALAVIPTSVAFMVGDAEKPVDCGAPLMHAFGGTNADEEVSLLSYEPIVPPDRSCREQSRVRLLLAGGLAVLTSTVGYLLLRPRHPDATIAAG